MCEELKQEYNKFFALLTNEDDKKYAGNASVKYLKYKIPGRNFYEWKKTDNATIYRRYDDIYVVTDRTVWGHPYSVAKLPVEKEIQIHGLYDLNERCNKEKNE